MKKNKKVIYLLKGLFALNLIGGAQGLLAQECPGGSSYCSQCGSCVESGAGCPPSTVRFTETETTALYVLPAGTYFACHVDEESSADTASKPKSYNTPVEHFRCSNTPTKENALTLKPYEAEKGKVHRLPSALHYQCEQGAPTMMVGGCYGMQIYKCAGSKTTDK